MLFAKCGTTVVAVAIDKGNEANLDQQEILQAATRAERVVQAEKAASVAISDYSTATQQMKQNSAADKLDLKSEQTALLVEIRNMNNAMMKTMHAAQVDF